MGKSTVLTVYGHQERAEVGYNPTSIWLEIFEPDGADFAESTKPGLPSSIPTLDDPLNSTLGK